MDKYLKNNQFEFKNQLEHIDPVKLVKISEPYPGAFYERDTRQVAREILGSLLVTEIDGKTLAGFIVEAEAYMENEEGCHAYGGMTPRCEVMFGHGGMAYIYFVYGMYWCFNATTEKEGKAGAVLVRAVEPFMGIEIMRHRRRKNSILELCSGPGKLTVAFGLDKNLDGWDLSKPPFRILSLTEEFKPKFKIGKSERIGLKKARELEYRYLVAGSSFISHH